MTPEHENQWQEVVKTFYAYISARKKLFSIAGKQGVLQAVRKGILDPHESAPGFDLARCLGEAALLEISEELIEKAIYLNGHTPDANDLLHKAPREPLIQKMREYAKVIEDRNEETDAGQFLGLAHSLDPALAQEIAAVFLNSKNPNVKAAAVEWFS